MLRRRQKDHRHNTKMSFRLALLATVALSPRSQHHDDVSLFASAFQIQAAVSIPQQSATQHCDADKIETLVKEKLYRIASGYQTHADKLKRTLVMELELSSKVEQCFIRSDGNAIDESLLLSTYLMEKKSRLEECLAINDEVVHRLLSTNDVSNNEQSPPPPPSLFDHIEFIPSAAAGGTAEYDDLGQLMGNGGLIEGGEANKETDGYDTALQVIHHTARDWTVGAAPCRDETILWIVRAIVQYYALDEYHGNGHDLRVLIPGAGLGRLAFEVSTCRDLIENGVVPKVEANDSSVTMIFATQNVMKMLQQQQQQGEQNQLQSAIFPFVSDPQVNEIDARKRFEMEVFPDECAIGSYQRYYELTGEEHPNLSFTVGDFVSIYSQETKESQYDVVATSFFIDTATNIYEYIFIIKHLLDSNGIWVNCGPTQWHPCALLRPTVEQLKDMLQLAGFELLSWSIADEVVAYRHPDDVGKNGSEARYTRSEAYRPLRFVARLSSQEGDGDGDSSGSDLPLKIQYAEYLNEVANGKVKLN